MMKTTIATIALLLGLSGYARSSAPPVPGAGQGSAEARAAASASSAEAAAKADVLLAESEIWVSEMEAAVKGGSDGSGCPPNFSLRTFLRDKKDKKTSKEIGEEIPDPDGKTKVEWEFYNVCNALSAKSPAACSELGEVVRQEQDKSLNAYTKGVAGGGGSSYAAYNTAKDKCNASYLFMRAKVAAVSRDPNFIAACKDTAPGMPPMKSPASVDAICAAWQNSSSGSLDALSAAIANGVKTPLKPEYVREVAREMVSDPAWCAASDQDDAKLGCMELNDYRAALAKKDAKTCKGGLCRMLMGAGAASCEPYAQKVKKQVCARYYRTKFSEDRGPLIEERLKIAEALITGAAGKVGGLKEAQAFTERLDRVYTLRDRLNAATLVLTPLGQKPQKAAPAKAGTKP